jgi:hypothetical protein
MDKAERDPRVDPRAGDRVVSGDVRQRASVESCGDGLVGFRGSARPTIYRVETLSWWRDWCLRNDARPVAGEGE